MDKTATSEYRASKIAEGKWGVFFHCALGSYGPKGRTFRTRREAQRQAREWNWAASQ